MRDLVRPKRQRYPQLRIETIMHIRRQHTDNCVRLAIHANVFADEVAIRIEVIGPQAIAENHHVVSARLPFFGKEVTAQHEWQSFEGEESRSPACTGNLLRT